MNSKDANKSYPKSIGHDLLQYITDAIGRVLLSKNHVATNVTVKSVDLITGTAKLIVAVKNLETVEKEFLFKTFEVEYVQSEDIQ